MEKIIWTTQFQLWERYSIIEIMEFDYIFFAYR